MKGEGSGGPARSPGPGWAGLLLGLALGMLLGLATWWLARRGLGLFVILPVVLLGGAWRRAAPFWTAFFSGLAAGVALTLALGLVRLLGGA